MARKTRFPGFRTRFLEVLGLFPSVQAMARATGLSAPLLRAYRDGRCGPTIEPLRRIARAAGKSEGWMKGANTEPDIGEVDISDIPQDRQPLARRVLSDLAYAPLSSPSVVQLETVWATVLGLAQGQDAAKDSRKDMGVSDAPTDALSAHRAH